MRKRWKWFAAGGLLSLILAATAFWAPSDEPRYKGQTLTTWIQIATHFGNTVLPNEARDAQAVAAVRHIGTNALPFLLDWIRLEPNAAREKLEKAVVQLPEAFACNRTTRSLNADKADFSGGLALYGFKILGPQAAPAIPELVQIMNATNRPVASESATWALGWLGLHRSAHS